MIYLKWGNKLVNRAHNLVNQGSELVKYDFFCVCAELRISYVIYLFFNLHLIQCVTSWFFVIICEIYSHFLSENCFYTIKMLLCLNYKDSFQFLLSTK